jgi:hypothetical protein
MSGVIMIGSPEMCATGALQPNAEVFFSAGFLLTYWLRLKLCNRL